jgi:hypothetical protein
MEWFRPSPPRQVERKVGGVTITPEAMVSGAGWAGEEGIGPPRAAK